MRELYCVVCGTVSRSFTCFGDLRFDLVWSNCEGVVRPNVTLCGLRGGRLQELTNCVRVLCVYIMAEFCVSVESVPLCYTVRRAKLPSQVAYCSEDLRC